MSSDEPHGGLTWITGGSQGLGKALALELARRGQEVVISARDREKLDAVCEEARYLDGSISAVAVDITDPAAVRKAVESIERDRGPIERAVLNAGTHKPLLGRDFDAETFAKLAEINLTGTANCLDPLLARMIDRGRGHVAIVASLSGYTGLPTAAAYGATKAGIINMTEALAAELPPLGIKVQLVNPGFVKTPLTDLNEFPMPFLMPAEKAARAFADGLESGRFEIVFPRRLAYILKVLRCLPYVLRLAVTRRMVPSGGEKNA